MQNCDVDLLCTEDGLDSSSTSGKLMISIMSAFAEMELENIHRSLYGNQYVFLHSRCH